MYRLKAFLIVPRCDTNKIIILPTSPTFGDKTWHPKMWWMGGAYLNDWCYTTCTQHTLVLPAAELIMFILNIKYKWPNETQTSQKKKRKNKIPSPSKGHRKRARQDKGHTLLKVHVLPYSNSKPISYLLEYLWRIQSPLDLRNCSEGVYIKVKGGNRFSGNFVRNWAPHVHRFFTHFSRVFTGF